jgi:hypothetical protein
VQRKQTLLVPGMDARREWQRAEPDSAGTAERCVRREQLRRLGTW